MLFNEPKLLKLGFPDRRALIERRFSALQRAEIAEIGGSVYVIVPLVAVSVLFNEPKLLKSPYAPADGARAVRFSALQRAEIAEIQRNP